MAHSLALSLPLELGGTFNLPLPLLYLYYKIFSEVFAYAHLSPILRDVLLEVDEFDKVSPKKRIAEN